VDAFCKQKGIDSVDILKVDVEGSEAAVFRGAEGLFQKRAVRNVFTEVYFNPLYVGMPIFADLDAHLKAKGFRLHGIYSLTPSYEGHVLGGNAFYRLAE
jgi:Methyltransferase FkbM domain